MKSTVYDALVTKQAELSGLIATLANEGRTANDDEKGRLAVLKTDIDTIKSEWEANGRRAFLASLDRTAPKTGLVLKSTDSFADHFKGQFDQESEGLSLDRMIRGVVTGNWSGAELERKSAMTTAVSSQGGFLVPEAISTRVIDLARNKSMVISAGAGTVPMTSMTMSLARKESDPTVAWYAENGTIGETDITFSRIEFKAKKAACILRVSNELLEDASNSQSVIESSIAAAIALEIDRTALLGTGVGQPLGVANTADVLPITAVGAIADYADFTHGIWGIRGYNFEPNAAIYSARVAELLAVLATGVMATAQPMPTDLAALRRLITNQVPNNLGAGTNESLAFIGQWDQYLFALRSDIRLEISREADTAFVKDQTLIRAVVRIDGQALNARAFALLSGITT